MAQNWNNLITYIKRELGAPVNAIELLDSEIQQQIIDLVMPEFSQYIGANLWYLMTPAMKTTYVGSANAYQLPLVAAGTEVTRVNAAYYDTTSSGIAATLNASAGMITNPFQSLPNSVYNQASAYLQPIKTYIFNKPDILVFNQLISASIILDLDVLHTNPNTIPGDLFHKAFKQLCLISIIDYIVAIRSKFTTVQTPLGEVTLNIDFLIQKADRMREEVKAVLNDIPPDPLIEWVT